MFCAFQSIIENANQMKMIEEEKESEERRVRGGMRGEERMGAEGMRG